MSDHLDDCYSYASALLDRTRSHLVWPAFTGAPLSTQKKGLRWRLLRVKWYVQGVIGGLIFRLLPDWIHDEIRNRHPEWVENDWED